VAPEVCKLARGRNVARESYLVQDSARQHLNKTKRGAPNLKTRGFERLFGSFGRPLSLCLHRRQKGRAFQFGLVGQVRQ
jgi:hypothetical protein